jgi:N-formylglutamate deformylase
VTAPFLTLRQGRAPLLVSLPHTGTDIPPEFESRLVSPWLARKDADWWIERLYDFAVDLDATILRTTISRTVVDVNRDPSGASLYPGQATTELCPTTTFDGEPLYRAGEALSELDVASRRSRYFAPYHQALAAEAERLRGLHPRIVLYDCHSIRSAIPRLFEGELPHFNIGTNSGASCDPALQRLVEGTCAATGFSWIANGRFKGGWITRHYGRPAEGVHAVQMELACRGYLREPIGLVAPETWPVPYDPDHAAPMRAALTALFQSLVDWARSPEGSTR